MKNKESNKSGVISILNFFQDIPKYIFNQNEKFRKWGVDNDIPFKLLNLYNSVPEHSSAINFILSNVVENEIDEVDYWMLQKLTLDYILFGGFAIKKIKLRNGEMTYEYVDIALCRLDADKKKIGYSENWDKYKVDIEWFPIATKLDQAGIFVFKNPTARGDYPTPRYISAVMSLDTMNSISAYHNNNANNGFTPNVVINFNNGEPDEGTKKEIEKQIQDKFTGVQGNKFILSFNESQDTATSIDKLDGDNLDEKFETLQKFIQNQIIVAHQITSGQLIGIKPENQGFSKTEYVEAMEIFEENVISGYRKELEYGLSELFGKDVSLKTNIDIVEEGNDESLIEKEGEANEQ